MQWLLSRAIYYIITLLNSTYRYRFVGLENLKEATQMGASKGFLLGIWHQNLFQGIMAQNGKHYVVIVSKSKDAEPVAYTCARLGHVVVRGSSRSKRGVDKGGKKAMDEMIDVLKTGIPGAVTVDGPKGPAHIVKEGIIAMAKNSDTPLVPYLPIPERYWTFNSWDHFRLPKPFARIIVYYDKPFRVDITDATNSFENFQAKLKSALEEKESQVFAMFSNWRQLSKSNNWKQSCEQSGNREI